MGYRGETALAVKQDFDEFQPRLRLVEGCKGKVEDLPSRKREAELEALIMDHRQNGRKLARSILRRWRVRMPAEELDSLVDLALCEAAARYSTQRGAAFMTFLFYHLRGHLVRAVARAAQASNMFLAMSQSNNVDAESWKSSFPDGVWPYLPDNFIFCQRDIATPEGELLRKERIDRCKEAISMLDELEKEIIERSFHGEQALVDIARLLGYSRCHVSRVKKSALARLRQIMVLEDAGPLKELSEEDESLKAIIESLQAKRRSRRRTIFTEDAEKVPEVDCQAA